MELPPEAGSIPALLAVRWLRDPCRLLEESRAKHGDAFTVRLPGMERPIVVVCSPAAVRDVFAMSADQGHAGKANALAKSYLGKHSLLLLDGIQHSRHRKMMGPALHGERMHAYGQSMLDLAHESFDAWPVGKSFSVKRRMQSITLQVMIRTVFGVGAGARFAELADALSQRLDVGGAKPFLFFSWMRVDLGRFSPWGRFLRATRRASEILRGEIRRGRAEGTAGRMDVLALLLEARDEQGQPLGEDEVYDELMGMLIAGYEATATALSWALRWILPDASLVRRLRDEIATAGGDPLRLGKLELLDATVKETLRLQPIVPFVGRVLQAPGTFGGIHLPAGVMVAPSIYLMHRRDDLYPEPTRFQPERFFRFKPASYEWIPFGGGLRRCIGAAFAIYEMKILLAALLSRIDLRLADDRVKLVLGGGVIFAPANGLPVIVVAKRPRAATAGG